MRSSAAWRLAQLLRTAAHDLLVVASAVVPMCAVFWVTAAHAGFDYIGSSWSESTRTAGDPMRALWRWDWLGWTLLYGAGFGLSAGAVRHQGRDAWAIAVACWTGVLGAGLVVFTQNFQFALPDHAPCLYEGCWPLYWQAVVVSAPMAVTLVVVILLGWWAERVVVWVRRVVPALVFITLMLLLALVWQPWVLPFLQGPPPWQSLAATTGAVVCGMG
ncbi:hypothetical protein [Actinomyces lilanjuaniae]|uniref:hypothetical protein n=1 Tax=Actinomyces lilanjuaniae TaxID=2321394 RepID=UPI0013C4E493|nr:hypothetical protein [Actinomyces lilanjuaniae]